MKGELGMKTLVIGGAGFIGSHFTDRLLAEGHHVTVFDNLSTGRKAYLQGALKNNKCRFVSGDILGGEALRRAVKGQDLVFHLAANSDIMRAMKDPALDFEQGIRATFCVLEALRKENVSKLVYFSGSGIYGDFGRTFVDESKGPLNPKSMYGAAKLSSEAMISAFSHLYGLQAWIFRPANIIGPRPTHGVIYDFICKLNSNPARLSILGDGSQTKSYLHVQDLLDAVFFILKKTRQPLNQFNLASETYISVREIAAIVTESMGLEGVKFIYGRAKRGWKGDVPHYRLSIKKIKSLGWKPKMTSTQAVERTAHEILAEMNLTGLTK